MKSFFYKDSEEKGILSRWSRYGRLALEVASELLFGEMVLPVRTLIKHFLLPLRKTCQAFASRIKESRFDINLGQ